MSFPFNLPIALTLFRIVLVPLIIVFVISSDRVRVLIAAGIFEQATRLAGSTVSVDGATPKVHARVAPETT
jgi:phosphatidylglycerophosphate synthase